MLLIKRIFGSRDRLQLAISKYSGSNDARDETKQMPLPREARTRDEAEQDRAAIEEQGGQTDACLLYTSPSPRDATLSRMPSSA